MKQPQPCQRMVLLGPWILRKRLAEHVLYVTGVQATDLWSLPFTNKNEDMHSKC